MAVRTRWDIGFGIVTMTLSLLALFVWFPNDIVGGFIEVSAIGRTVPGDAFFPVLLAVGIFVLGALQALLAVRRALAGRPTVARTLTRSNARFIAALAAIVLSGLALMVWLGPLVVDGLNVIGLLDGSYRNFSDTAPFKYIGFVVGGFAMTAALIVLTEGRVRRASLASITVVIAGAIIIFDILLKNVLLPPN